MRELNAEEAAKLVAGENEVVFVDVRSRAEFAGGHPAGAVNVPVAEPDQWGQMLPNPNFVEQMRELVPDTSLQILMVCEIGMRSGYACELLESLGYQSTINLAGGVTAWRATSGPWQAGDVL
jgi:rhodanese-related sulfurtransferase